MAARVMITSAHITSQASPAFTQMARFAALLTGVSGLLYAVAFIVLRNPLLSGLFLMLFGLLSTAALLGVYRRIQPIDADVALLALVFSIGGSLGAAMHGGYDLANALNPPTAAVPDLPSAIDPRGLLTFGVAGLALLIIAWLMARGRHFPRGLVYLGYVSAILLIVLYLGRLIVLDAASPLILVPALINGFLLQPLWYVWVGLTLGREPAV
jgi:hypothetical protein